MSLYCENIKVKDNDDIEDIISNVSINIRRNSLITNKDKDKLKFFVSDLLNTFEEKIKINNNKNNNFKKYLELYNESFNILRRKYDIFPKKSQLNYVYRLKK